MQIAFEKVPVIPKEFKAEVSGLSLCGTLEKISRDIVKLKARLTGVIKADCDRCGKHFILPQDQELELRLSDRLIQTQDDLDIIEFLDGIIDIEYIIQSEIESQKALYNYCEDCNDKEDYEIEF
ncbi:MAG: hypothetical protein JXQ68_03615 [Campylobacterales bacterium]|nr:hypothetical protein [Campylobacterales bacterium]